MANTMRSVDLRSLLTSWQVSLRADHKSPETIKSYTTGVDQFLAWCEANGNTPPALEPELVCGYVAHLMANGAGPATARTRQLAVRRFSTWCREEGEVDHDPLLGVAAPKLVATRTATLTDDEVRRLVEACGGKDMRDRRDEAVVRLMLETGMRAGEVLALTVDDVDVARGTVRVVRGHDGRARVVPFGPHTARALDRYVRARRTHRLAHTPALWLGDRGKSLAYFGLRNTLQHRAELAGIKGFHLQVLRHTAASRWLAAGGSEAGLMSIAGWTRRNMLERYSRSTAAERAAAEARSLNLGEI